MILNKVEQIGLKFRIDSNGTITTLATLFCPERQQFLQPSAKESKTYYNVRNMKIRDTEIGRVHIMPQESYRDIFVVEGMKKAFRNGTCWVSFTRHTRHFKRFELLK